jgi:hypothetical protein
MFVIIDHHHQQTNENHIVVLGLTQWPRSKTKLHIINHESKEITTIYSNIFLLIELTFNQVNQFCNMGNMFVSVAFEKSIQINIRRTLI